MLYIMSSGKCKLKLYTYLERPKSKTLTIPNNGEAVEQKLSFIPRERKNGTANGKQFGGFLQNLHILLSYDPAIILFTQRR